jgi:hypothetical protein
VLEVHAVKHAHYSLWFGEIEDAALTSRTKDANNFAQSGVVVCQISKTESRGHQIEVLIWEWKRKRVSFDPPWSGRIQPEGLCNRPLEHRMSKICTDDLRLLPPSLLAQSKGHVAGPAAEIKYSGIRAFQDVAESSGGATPP